MGWKSLFLVFLVHPDAAHVLPSAGQNIGALRHSFEAAFLSFSTSTDEAAAQAGWTLPPLIAVNNKLRQTRLGVFSSCTQLCQTCHIQRVPCCATTSTIYSHIHVFTYNACTVWMLLFIWQG